MLFFYEIWALKTFLKLLAWTISKSGLVRLLHRASPTPIFIIYYSVKKIRGVYGASESDDRNYIISVVHYLDEIIIVLSGLDKNKNNHLLIVFRQINPSSVIDYPDKYFFLNIISQFWIDIFRLVNKNIIKLNANKHFWRYAWKIKANKNQLL